jgi:hypothetical protein
MNNGNGRLAEYERLVEAKQKMLDTWLRPLKGGCGGVLVRREGTTIYFGPDFRYPQSWMATMPAIQVFVPSDPGDSPEDLDRYRIVIHRHRGSEWTVERDRTYQIARHDPVAVLQKLFTALTKIAHKLANRCE